MFPGTFQPGSRLSPILIRVFFPPIPHCLNFLIPHGKGTIPRGFFPLYVFPPVPRFPSLNLFHPVPFFLLFIPVVGESSNPPSFSDPLSSFSVGVSPASSFHSWVLYLGSQPLSPLFLFFEAHHVKLVYLNFFGVTRFVFIWIVHAFTFLSSFDGRPVCSPRSRSYSFLFSPACKPSPPLSASLSPCQLYF